MDQETRNAEGSSELRLSEPHFDDESTVLSARQVVPLEEVPAYESPKTLRLTRKWMFAAIVLGSLLLGVVGGAGYYSYLNRRPAQTFVDIDELAAGIEGISTEQAEQADVADVRTRTPLPAPSDDAPAELSEKEISESLKEPAEYPGQTRRPVARRGGVITSSSDRDEEQIREERKAARREAKERRRQLERESRRSRNDLTRIREIFEGPQKP
ncbi:MAG: hypothetical protein ACR2H4_08230 [Pyrinomonadaceae bacterium]